MQRIPMDVRLALVLDIVLIDSTAQAITSNSVAILDTVSTVTA
jgi:hypothetical protein